MTEPYTSPTLLQSALNRGGITKPSSTPQKQKRRTMTITERAALRRHAHAHPNVPQRALQAWFEEQFGFPISQGTVSDSLNPRFSGLDFLSPDAASSATRYRAPKWPELEDALGEWRRSNYGDDQPIPDQTMRTKAAQTWAKLAEDGIEGYKDVDCPGFSNGWLQGFKRRNNVGIRARRGNGEFYRDYRKGILTGDARTGVWVDGAVVPLGEAGRSQQAGAGAAAGDGAARTTTATAAATTTSQTATPSRPSTHRASMMSLPYPSRASLASDAAANDALRQETVREKDSMSSTCLARLNALHPYHLHAILFSAALRHKDVRDALCIGDTETLRTPYAFTAHRTAQRLFAEFETMLADDDVLSSMGYTVDAQATHQFQCTKTMLDYLANECVRHLSPRYVLDTMRRVVLAICETSEKEDVDAATRATIEKFRTGAVFPDAMMGVVEGLSGGAEGRKGVLTELFEVQLVEMEGVCSAAGVFEGMDRVRCALGGEGEAVLEEWRAGKRGREVLEGTFDGRW